MSAGLEPPYGARDAGGMAARIAGIPAQIDDALERDAREPWPAPAVRPDLLAVGAMGGSAMAAEPGGALYRDRLPRPLVVVRDYRWPAFVTPASLVLLASYSGGTGETLALYGAAGVRGVPRLALTTGGTLAEWCRRDGVPMVALPSGSPPRAALFAAWVALTALLERLGWVEGAAEEWRRAGAALRARDATLGPGTPEARNPAKRLARELTGRMPLIYAGPGSPAAVATRMRQQVNENAKMLAHSALVPELNHNEIVGWERPGAPHAAAAVVILRDAEDPPEVATRLALTADYARRQGAAVHEIDGGEGGRLARAAALVQFVDYLSFYLAIARGVDPTPIASIDEFKRRLAEQGARRGE